MWSTGAPELRCGSQVQIMTDDAMKLGFSLMLLRNVKGHIFSSVWVELMHRSRLVILPHLTHGACLQSVLVIFFATEIILRFQDDPHSLNTSEQIVIKFFFSASYRESGRKTTRNVDMPDPRIASARPSIRWERIFAFSIRS